MIRGLGPADDKRLVTTFGEAVFDVIEADPIGFAGAVDRNSGAVD